jgi:sigma-B regulation protein RsbU (phosphoserine phosphatase)
VKSSIANAKPQQESFDDFFEENLCGFIIADSKAIITKANKTLAKWTGYTPEELAGKRFSDILTISGKVYYETHLSPLLKMQGFFDEVMLEILHTSGSRMQVIINALDRKDETGNVAFTRFTILKGGDRLIYEQNLKHAKKETERKLADEKRNVTLREQLIAVLGHDLRNPLSSIVMAAQLLDDSTDKTNSILIGTLKRSAYRIQELITKIMDFAKTRLGEGIVLNRRNILIKPVIEQVIAELKIVHPATPIIAQYDVTGTVNCDSSRIAQLASNLVSNALTHGEKDTPVIVRVVQNDTQMELSVINKGNPIPEVLHQKLFEPFNKESLRASRQGLGLGLYICAEIARAHNASLTFTSDEQETSFRFYMEY